jgi:hypothetical protein
MKSILSMVGAITFIWAAFTPLSASATAYNVDDNAQVVKLRTSCTEGSSPVVTLDNCFDNSADLRDWIEGVRLPGPSNPLAIEIGPGTFTAFDLSCITVLRGNETVNYEGNITFRGSGTDQTIIAPQATRPWTISGCANMTFSDFSFHATGQSQYTNYITWENGGSSVWRNVDVTGFAYAWRAEECTSADPHATHYWFGSRLKVVQTPSHNIFATVYKEGCDKSWFFGSELTFDCTAGCPQGGTVIHALGDTGEVHVYGSVIRALGGATGNPNFTAALAEGSGMIHIHGTGIDLLTPTATQLIGLHAIDTGRVHADDSAFNVSTGPGGTITRILDETTSGPGVHAPYLWTRQDAPPSIISKDGADVAVVNESTGPRFLIYNSACASKWYDVGNNACRP